MISLIYKNKLKYVKTCMYMGKIYYHIINWNFDICDDFAHKLHDIITTHDSIILLWNLQKKVHVYMNFHIQTSLLFNCKINKIINIGLYIP